MFLFRGIQIWKKESLYSRFFGHFFPLYYILFSFLKIRSQDQKRAVSELCTKNTTYLEHQKIYFLKVSALKNNFFGSKNGFLLPTFFSVNFDVRKKIVSSKIVHFFILYNFVFYFFDKMRSLATRRQKPFFTAKITLISPPLLATISHH